MKPIKHYIKDVDEFEALALKLYPELREIVDDGWEDLNNTTKLYVAFLKAPYWTPESRSSYFHFTTIEEFNKWVGDIRVIESRDQLVQELEGEAEHYFPEFNDYEHRHKYRDENGNFLEDKYFDDFWEAIFKEKIKLGLAKPEDGLTFPYYGKKEPVSKYMCDCKIHIDMKVGVKEAFEEGFKLFPSPLSETSPVVYIVKTKENEAIFNSIKEGDEVEGEGILVRNPEDDAFNVVQLTKIWKKGGDK